MKTYGEYNRYFNGKLKKGDKLRFTGSSVEFTLVGEPGDDHDLCTKVQVKGGPCHYLFLGSGEVETGMCAGMPVDVAQQGPEYKFGRCYKDMDGEYFLRGSKDSSGVYQDGWFDCAGEFFTDNDDYVRLPMEGPFE